jgi:hypothetical protein
MDANYYSPPKDETRITSSNLESVKYDKATETLYVRFVGTGKYRHAQYAYDAPEGFYNTILEIAEHNMLRGKPISVGEWFGNVFRKSEHYKTSRIVDQPFG